MGKTKEESEESSVKGRDEEGFGKLHTPRSIKEDTIEEILM